MKKLISLLSTLFLLFTVTAYADETSSSDPKEAIVRQQVSEFMQQNGVPGVAVEVYVNGRPYSYYYGYANPEKKVPVTKNTIFELGSITKIMTNVLLTQEVDFAKIYLTDPVKKYIKELPDEFNDIKVQDLATHVSGLPFNAPQNITSRTDLEKYLTTWSPEEASGYQWKYSNFGMGMLGFVLETETNKNFDQLYRKHILQPLRMQEIGLVVPKRLKQNYAQGFDLNGKPVPATELGLFPSANGVKASAEDMQKFLGAAVGVAGTPERIFYPMRMTQAAYVRLPDRLEGLGWQIHTLSSFRISRLLNESEDPNLGPIKVEEIYGQPKFDGDALLDKTGATNGFRAYIAVIPNRKTGVTVLSNRYVSNKAIVELGRKILFKLNGMA